MPASLTTFTNRILQGAAASLIVLALALLLDDQGPDDNRLGAEAHQAG